MLEGLELPRLLPGTQLNVLSGGGGEACFRTEA